jgi:hypothetical protein
MVAFGEGVAIKSNEQIPKSQKPKSQKANKPTSQQAKKER